MKQKLTKGVGLINHEEFINTIKANNNDTT